MFIPSTSILARHIIEHCHHQTLHGGVIHVHVATMCKVRERCWIPVSKQLETGVLVRNNRLLLQISCYVDSNHGSYRTTTTTQTMNERRQLKGYVTSRHAVRCVRRRWLNDYHHALQERFTSSIQATGRAIPGNDAIVLVKDTTSN